MPYFFGTDVNYSGSLWLPLPVNLISDFSTLHKITEMLYIIIRCWQRESGHKNKIYGFICQLQQFSLKVIITACLLSAVSMWPPKKKTVIGGFRDSYSCRVSIKKKSLRKKTEAAEDRSRTPDTKEHVFVLQTLTLAQSVFSFFCPSIATFTTEILAATSLTKMLVPNYLKTNMS